MNGKQARDESLELLRMVHLPDPESSLEAYPHQLSGGMCQRVMIAMALSCQPKLLIADEPTASLDVTIQAQIMDLLLELRERFGMAILLVSHDLGVIARMCDRIAVMYLGRIVEVAEAESLYSSPKHPYTQALLRAVPVPDPRRRQEPLLTLSGDVPSAIRIPGGCRFRTRCPEVTPECADLEPQLMEIDDTGRSVACILYRESHAVSV
jgi:oligopeptide/dipeptide ABC transporter ATP-binding protein